VPQRSGRVDRAPCAHLCARRGVNSVGLSRPSGIHENRAKKGSVMGARTPEDLDRLFALALNSGDMEALVRLYEPQAALAPGTGSGGPGPRGDTHGARRLHCDETDARACAPSTGTVRTTSRSSPASWTLKGTGADGAPVQMSGNSVEVARRQAMARGSSPSIRPGGSSPSS
jgi:hypothetical protein